MSQIKQAIHQNHRSKTRPTGIFLVPFQLLGILLLAGCCFPISGKQGETHHLILGLGVVTVKDLPDKAVIVTDTEALGLSVSDRPGLKLGIGYSSSVVTTVGNGAKDVRIEVSKSLGLPLIIDTQSAILKETNKFMRREADNENE